MFKHWRETFRPTTIPIRSFSSAYLSYTKKVLEERIIAEKLYIWTERQSRDNIILNFSSESNQTKSILSFLPSVFLTFLENVSGEINNWSLEVLRLPTISVAFQQLNNFTDILSKIPSSPFAFESQTFA